jgi:hypothetical protein
MKLTSGLPEPFAAPVQPLARTIRGSGAVPWSMPEPFAALVPLLARTFRGSGAVPWGLPEPFAAPVQTPREISSLWGLPPAQTSSVNLSPGRSSSFWPSPPGKSRAFCRTNRRRKGGGTGLRLHWPNLAGGGPRANHYGTPLSKPRGASRDSWDPAPPSPWESSHALLSMMSHGVNFIRPAAAHHDVAPAPSRL